VAVKCLILVIEQKFKIQQKAEKEIHQNTNSDLRKIAEIFAAFHGIFGVVVELRRRPLPDGMLRSDRREALTHPDALNDLEHR